MIEEESNLYLYLQAITEVIGEMIVLIDSENMIPMKTEEVFIKAKIYAQVIEELRAEAGVVKRCHILAETTDTEEIILLIGIEEDLPLMVKAKNDIRGVTDQVVVLNT